MDAVPQPEPSEHHTKSVYGGARSVVDGALQQAAGAAGSVAGSQMHKQAAGGQPQAQPSSNSAWSMLGKMYSSQVLAYMVAITDAQALVRRMRSMRPGPPLLLPGEVECMDVWQVLNGSVKQQRVWTFGNQATAKAVTGAAEALSAEQGITAQQGLSGAVTSLACTAGSTATAAGSCPAMQPCISSQEPQSIKNGVCFVSCAAGNQHSAAAAEGGYVYTWGSNDRGQLGCDTTTQPPIMVHILDPASVNQTVVLNGAQHAATSTAGAFGKSDSIKLLSSTIRLPPSLIFSLQQHRQHQQQAAIEQQEQDQLLLAELQQLQHQQQQQQLAGKPPGPQPAAAQVAVHQAVLAAINTSQECHRSAGEVPQLLQQHKQQQDQQQAATSPSLMVYRLHLGQAVRAVACGAYHTLAALASPGLMAWGLNDKGQLGAPPGLYKQVNQPMRIHGFDGQCLLCISAGAKHSAAVQEGGVVVTWGHGKYGRLGVGGTPDILPPSAVSGLRGCYATQVACGTAHTLVLTADARVYAFGFNGQGALGTGDQQDRMHPVLVPGLPPCVQVAAAASSMALSNSGEVYLWGGAAGRLVNQASKGSGKESIGSSSSNNNTAHAEGKQVDAAVASQAKHVLPWLTGVQAVQIGCGIDTSAALSCTGEVLLWGNSACLPSSMMGSASGLLHPPAAEQPAVLEEGPVDQQQRHTRSQMHSEQKQPHKMLPAEVQAGPQLAGPSCSATADIKQQLAGAAVHVELDVGSSGQVHVKLMIGPQSSTSAAGRQLSSRAISTATGAEQQQIGATVAAAPQPKNAQPSSSSGGNHQQQPQRQKQEMQQVQQIACQGNMQDERPANHRFDPSHEAVADMACGAAHHVLLCQQSQHNPSPDEIRAAILAVLHAYIISFNSQSTSGLNLLMMQQQPSRQGPAAADYEGSVVDGGVARSVKSVRPAGCAASKASFAGSTTSTLKALKESWSAARPGSPGHEHANTDGSSPRTIAGSVAVGHGSASGASQSHRTPLLGLPRESLASTTAASSSQDLVAADTNNAAAAGTVAGSNAGGSLTGGRVGPKSCAFGGYAASVAAGSVAQGLQPSSASGVRVGSGVGSTCPSMDLHGVLLLCHEVGLLDNITEHTDVISAFQLVLHRKRGRLGPTHTNQSQAGAIAGQATAGAALPAMQPLEYSGGSPNISASGPAVPLNEPHVLKVVHVVRPGQPAALTPGLNGTAAASLPNSRPASPGPEAPHETSGHSRPVSRGKYGRSAVSRAAAEASGMDSILSLEAGEVLELLLLLMKERHPCYRRQPHVLLRMLATWHIARLKGRKPDKGPPWLLRQVLQPDLLCAIESPNTTTLLHGIYVYLAGSSANPQDLSMDLSDLRLGLKHAAGYRTAQDYKLEQQQQQKQCCRSLARNSSSWSPHGKPGSLTASFLGSTESSRSRSTGPIGRNQAGVCRSLGLSGLADGSGFGSKSFHVPLHKLATFIRAAKLLPRLLEKYLAQLQLKGQEQRVARGGIKLDSLPVMPCLQAHVPYALPAGSSLASQSGQKRKSHLSTSGISAQRMQRPGSPSRLALLKEVSMVSLSSSAAAGGVQSQQLPQQEESLDAFLDALPSPAPFTRSSSSRPMSGVSSAIQSRRGSIEGHTAREHVLQQPAQQQHQQRQYQHLGAKGPRETPTSGYIDACALDDVELVPLRSKSVTMVITFGATAQNANARAAALRAKSAPAAGSSSGGNPAKIVLQLPPPQVSSSDVPVPDGSGGSGVAYGNVAGRQVVDTQLSKRDITRAAGKPGSAAGNAQANFTYQQQQQHLKEQRSAAEASARRAEAQQAACQDAWIVCMLVELLGSNLITPTWTATIQMPPPDSAAAGGNNQENSTCSGTSSRPPQSAPQVDDKTGAMEPKRNVCCWDRGYCFIDPAAAGNSTDGTYIAAKSSSGGSGVGGGSSSSGEVPVTILDHGITYPQFVQVLLCLMAARSVSILEPDVKQLRPLSLDEELQDHARVVLRNINKWRTAELAPWKVQQQESPVAADGLSTAKPGNAAGPPASVVTPGSTMGPGAAGLGGKLQKGPEAELPGMQTVANVYGAYSSMKIGSTVLALHKDGFLQLMRDAGIVGSSGEVSIADAGALFSQAAGAKAGLPPSKQLDKPNPAVAPTEQACPDAAASSSAPPRIGPDQRQSTFMRSVTTHLLQRLEANGMAAAVGNKSGVCAAASASSDPQAATKLSIPAPAQSQENQQLLQGCAGQPPVSQDVAQDAQASAAATTAAAAGAREPDTEQPWNAASCSTSSVVSGSCSRPSSQGSAACSASRSSSAVTGSSSGSRLTTPGFGSTRPDSGAATADAGQSKQAVMTLSQFLTVLVLLSRRCFPRIGNGSKAWQLLLQRHLQPLADRKRNRYDKLAAGLSTPAVVALLQAWGQHMQHLFDDAATTAAAAAEALPPQTDSAGGLRLPSQGPYNHGDRCSNECKLSLAAFLELLQEKGAIPQLLEPSDVQEVLKQLQVARTDMSALFTSLDNRQFTQALAMCGLAAFAGRRMQQSPHKAPEQQLAAFLTHMGLPPLPGHQQQLVVPAAGATAVGRGAGAKGVQAGGQQSSSNSTYVLRRQLANDPYIEWWSMRFDPSAESRAHDYLSTLTYMPVMLQEVVQPPPGCPSQVLQLLAAAQAAQQCRSTEDALHLFELAEEAWRDWHEQQPAGVAPAGMLPPSAVLYLAVAVAGCLLSTGHDEDASCVLQDCAGVLQDVHEAGADTAVWHAAAAVAKYHCDDLQGAFEHCVRAYVIRSECGSLGPSHPDTATAGHNLGVVLDCLGKSTRGLQLVEEAQQVLTAALGAQHPRTLIAARNAHHIKHKIIKLPASPQELPNTDLSNICNTATAAPKQTASMGRDQFVASAGKGSSTNGPRRPDPRAKGRRKNGVGVNGGDVDESSSSGSRSDGSSEEDEGAVSSGRTRGRGGKAGGSGSPGTSSKRGLGRTGSMQERLQAAVHARQSQRHSSGGDTQHQCRDYTDLDHLGAGVFRPTAEQRRLYELVQADIKAHAQGSSTYQANPGLVEIQVLKPPGVSLSAGAAKGPWSAVVQAMDRAAEGASGNAVCSASAQAVSAALPRAPASAMPHCSVGAACVREVHKGSLPDATIAAMKRPLSVEQARRLRRRQQQLAARASGKVPAGTADMLDKLF